MINRILVVDDDPHIRDVLCFALEKAGLTTLTARDGVEALQLCGQIGADLMVLDIGMPEMDGLEVCRQLRRTSDMPILFLSAHDEEIDRVLGLEIGGDDYVTKPFSPRELVARVKTILKRANGRGPVSAAEAVLLSRGALMLDPAAHRVSFDDKPVPLTAIEFAILQALLVRPGLVLSREQILDAAYPPNLHVSDRTIDSHIRNIRVKLTQAGCADAIDTVHGVGFRIGACEALR
jgi:two-component system OmpR family response regulator